MDMKQQDSSLDLEVVFVLDLNVATRMILTDPSAFQILSEMYNFPGIIRDIEYSHHIWIILQQSQRRHD